MANRLNSDGSRLLLTEDESSKIKSFLEEANRNRRIEIEIRLGKTGETSVRPGVEADVFFRLKNAIKAEAKKLFSRERSIDTSYGDIKRSESRITKKTTYQRKVKKGTYDILDYGIRVGMAEETPIRKPEVLPVATAIRFKDRESFLVEGALRVDFTMVKQVILSKNVTEEKGRQLIFSPDIPVRFEVEIEFIGNKFKTPKSITVATVRKVLEMVEKVRQDSYYLVTKTEVDQVIAEYKKLLKLEKNVWVGSKPVTMTNRTLPIIQKETYSVTPKADGDRTLLFVDGKGDCYIIKSDLSVTKTGLKNENSDLHNSILDGELANSKKGGKLYLGFDILVRAGRDLRDQASALLECRLNFVNEAIKGISVPSNTPIEYKLVIMPKEFILVNIFDGAKKLLESQDSFPFETDGLIYTPVNVAYPKSTRVALDTFKWKTKKDSTIDFFVIKTGLTNQNKTEVWELFMKTTDNKKQAVGLGEPIRRFTPKGFGKVFKTFVPRGQLTKNGEPFMDRTVIEFYFDPNQGQQGLFVPLRNRWDKTARKQPGNFEKFAFQAWETIQNPVTEESITQVPQGFVEKAQGPSKTDQAMEKRKNSQVINLRKFHNWVKEKLLTSVTKGAQQRSIDILDLASGRGGDIQKYIRNVGVNSVIGFDIDLKSVQEARKRVSDMDTQDKFFEFHQMDLSTESVFTFLQKNGLDGDFQIVVSNFAFHFFFESEKKLVNMMRNVSENLSEGGVFIGTAFDGSRIFELLKDIKKGESLTGSGKGCKVWEITKEYSDRIRKFDDLPMYGNAISVFLGDTLFFDSKSREYLINFDKFARIAKRFGLEFEKLEGTEAQIPFEALYQEWKSPNKSMSQAEQSISFLNTAFILKKMRPSKLEKLRVPRDRIISISPVPMQQLFEIVEQLPKSPPEISTKVIKEISKVEKKPPLEPPKPEPKTPEITQAKWIRLPQDWKEFLGTNEFVRRDCGAGGDCQFLSIAFGLKKAGLKAPDKGEWTGKKVREIVSKVIDEMPKSKFNEEVRPFLDLEFIDNTLPKSDIAKVIAKKGEYWGDEITLTLLATALNTNFMIFNDRTETKTINLIESTKKTPKFMGLYLTGLEIPHYLTIGKATVVDSKTKITTVMVEGDIKEISGLFKEQPKKTPSPRPVKKKAVPKKIKKRSASRPRASRPTSPTKELKLIELKELARKHNMRISGRKAELIERLKKAGHL